MPAQVKKKIFILKNIKQISLSQITLDSKLKSTEDMETNLQTFIAQGRQRRLVKLELLVETGFEHIS